MWINKAGNLHSKSTIFQWDDPHSVLASVFLTSARSAWMHLWKSAMGSKEVGALIEILCYPGQEADNATLFCLTGVTAVKYVLEHICRNRSTHQVVP